MCELIRVIEPMAGRLREWPPSRRTAALRGTVEGMLGMTKRHEIQVLRKAGHAQVAVAAATGTSRTSVQRVGAEPPVTTFDDGAERVRRRIGRPSTAEPLRPFLAAQLAADADLLGVELLRRAKQQGHVGAKSALYPRNATGPGCGERGPMEVGSGGRRAFHGSGEIRRGAP